MRWWCVVVAFGLLPFGCSVDEGGYAVDEAASGMGGDAGASANGGRAGSGGSKAQGGDKNQGGDGNQGGSQSTTPGGGASAGESGSGSGGEPNDGRGEGGAPAVPPDCGDGTLDDGEDCDDGDANNDDEEGACNTRCFINECDNGATQSCAEAGAEGNCADGEMTCEDGEWSGCSVEPQSADDCAPGDDANCNGEPNEDCGCVEGETTTCSTQYASLGECAKLTLTCTDSGTWPTNESCAAQSAEVCGSSTTSDEDCDGEDDEDDECDDCPATNPCKNGGSCVDGDGDYACACASGFTGPTCEQKIFTALGWPSGFSSCYTGGMSGNGQWVSAQCGGDYTPYRWSRSTGWIRVQGDYPIYGMNFEGTLAASNTTGTGSSQAVRWSSTSGATPLPSLNSDEYTRGIAISDDGNVILGMDADGSRLLKWTGTAAPVVLNRPSGAGDLWGSAIVLSGDGTTAFGYDGSTLVRWTTSTTGVLVDPDEEGLPYDANTNGSTAVGFRWIDAGGGTQTQPFAWTQGSGIEPLENQGLGGRARGISGDGSIIVGELGGWDTGLDSAAAFWRGIDADATRLFNYLEDKGSPVTGWSQTRLFAISRDGTTILGEGVSESRGSVEAFIVVLPP